MRYKTEVVASDMIILESRTARENASSSSNNYDPPSRDRDRDTPRSSSSSSNRSYDPPPDIGDEDIPF
jgi:single-stranded DNA-binding protein